MSYPPVPVLEGFMIVLPPAYVKIEFEIATIIINVVELKKIEVDEKLKAYCSGYLEK